MPLNDSHIAWDGGAIDAAFLRVFGRITMSLKPKTTKTMCGLRVGAAVIANQTATCDRCRLIRSELDREIDVLRETARTILSKEEGG